MTGHYLKIIQKIKQKKNINKVLGLKIYINKVLGQKNINNVLRLKNI